MLDFKLLAVACAAFFFVWKVFNKRDPLEGETEENLFERRAHDIVLAACTDDSRVSTKLRGSYKHGLVTIGRLGFNSLQVANPLISSEHAMIKWDNAHNCWFLKDVGSMNGTRLNDKVISTENRRPGEEHPLRHGDHVILADAVTIQVALRKPEKAAGQRLAPQTSSLRIAPRTGMIKAKLNTSRLTSRDHTAVLLNTSKPEQEEYYCEALDAEFAILSQVGSEHIKNQASSEDVVFWRTPFANYIRSGIFGVCDGHLGAEASTLLSRLFPSVLSKHLNEDSSTLISTSDGESILRSTFLEVDSKLNTDAGSTATILLAERMDNGTLCIQTANVGDSFGILINTTTGRITPLAEDHRVANEKERRRLQQLGNPISKNCTRLFMLNLARAMGDTSLKKINTSLIAEPYVSPVVRITPNKEHLIVIASDGLWDSVRQQEVAKLAVKAVQNWEGLRAFGNALINLATQERGATDDISIFLTRF